MHLDMHRFRLDKVFVLVIPPPISLTEQPQIGKGGQALP
jgi:hypothetical protein